MAWRIEFLKRLTDHGIPFVIVGGVAAITHGTNRITEDLDICAPLDHETAVRIIRAFSDLEPKWWVRRDLPVIKEDSANLRDLKNMYLITTWGRIDILGEVPGVGNFDEIKSRAVTMLFGETLCQVIDLDTLIQSKKTAGRVKDKKDLRELLLIRDMLKQRKKPAG
ncbi:MAG TPA: hypothetical protein VGG19_00800 [Tepidisphaeraceae bacterium]|jgi:predicted nucleotidyltransferase